MAHLELAIWKYSLLHYSETRSFVDLKELLEFFLKPRQKDGEETQDDTVVEKNKTIPINTVEHVQISK